MKKRLFTLLLVAAMLLSVLSGCGGSGETAEKAEDGSGEITLTIWNWDEEHMNYINPWYEEKHPGIKIETLVVSPQDYPQKFQSAVAAGTGVPDIVLCEQSFRGKVFEMGVLEDLTQEPYNVKTEDMFDFAAKLGGGQNGELLGIETQICPSGFAYRRDLAKEYLGTDDPDEIAAMISDWDKMFDVAQMVSEKSGGKVTALPGISVLLNLILATQNADDYIFGDEINLTERFGGIMETACKFNQAGLLGIQEDNSPAMSASYAAGEVLFYPAAPWSFKWQIVINDPEGSGNWGLTTAPDGGFTYGGTSVCIYSGSEHKAEAWEYINEVYGTGEGVQKCYEQFGFMPGFKAPYEEEEPYFFTTEGQYDEYFGGQKLAEYIINNIAITTKGEIPTKNETNVKAALQNVSTQLAADRTIGADKAMELLAQEVQTLIPEAVIK